jgi:hypothetical protein
MAHQHEEEDPKKYEPKEYELMPVTPLRHLEKRMESIEKGGPAQKTLGELIETLRANQPVFQELIRLNTEMIRRVSDLVSVVSTLSTQVADMVAKRAPEEHMDHEESDKKIAERMDKLEKRVNALLLAAMPRMRRPMPAPQYGPPAGA